MNYGIVAVPAAPVRRKPRHQREMTNQLLFGEAVKILKVKGDGWLRIRSLHDQYEGWMRANLLQEVAEAETKSSSTHFVPAIANLVMMDGLPMYVPFGSSLPSFAGGKGKIGPREFYYNDDFIAGKDQQCGGDLLEQWTRKWLNAPYLWGGRTMFGVDCSGFVQLNFKLMGINLPRDAWQQAQEGHAVKKWKEVVKGDLAFFDDKEEIVHVGILLGNEQVIHASGKVRIDQIDKKGIIQSETGKRTHQLKAIRRFW